MIIGLLWVDKERINGKIICGGFAIAIIFTRGLPKIVMGDEGI
jgi:hypothetical protein